MAACPRSRTTPTSGLSWTPTFHHSIAEATHNPMMIFSLRSIFELIRQGVFYNRYVVYLEAGGKDRLLEQHQGPSATPSSPGDVGGGRDGR